MGFAVNESQAIYDYISGFGIPAYAFTAVPDDATMPYITYEYQSGDLYSGEQLFEVNIWYRTESEAVLNAKAREIRDSLPTNVRYDTGTVWIKRGSPFSYPVQTDDNAVKRRRVNLSIEFNTSD